MHAIREFVMAEPLFETHTHQLGFTGHDWEKKLFDDFIAYGMADLATAGVPFEAGNKEKIFAAWPFVRTTGYGQATAFGVQALFGLAFSADTADAITAAMRAFCKGKTSRQIHEELYAHANIRWSINDMFWAPPCDPAIVSGQNHPAFFNFVMRAESSAHEVIGTNRAAVEEFAARLNLTIHTLADVVAALDACTEKAKATGRLAGLKIAQAYGRTLNFEHVPATQAARLFDAMMQGKDVGTKPLQDYLVHRIFQRARTFALPVQVHTGYLAGNGQDIRQGDPTPLVSVFREYQDVRFDVFHASWPWSEFIGAVAKELPNVWLDLCWAWAMNPVQSERILDEWLAAVPSNKLFAFGGDTMSPFGEIGYALQARHGIARTLQRKIERGEYDAQTARFVARRIMHENAREFFGM